MFPDIYRDFRRLDSQENTEYDNCSDIVLFVEDLLQQLITEMALDV
jgi:hypothetical protein